ncbi:DUF3500 domain-containing protein [Jiulongibacter sediminis]|uniref:DUF3500 domain-containing protein n=1 Tax=Jiulongibacter sediminis TaxID=1605367 RepID=A0A0P7BUX6_9BACT|nr:DUF3500 domain-containing protein [Jiulongibacter sediminis]KPM48490.1 hypothetical protein AFM12_07635 [Jiulongibacter sediminis]TBX25028.1 hypothetical protein TK44_07640 [Jiulongibacter sediminis]
MNRKLTYLFLSFTFCLTSFGQTTDELAGRLQIFLGTLDANETNATHYSFDNPLRTEWTNLPVGLQDRPGIRYGDLREESKMAFHDVLTTLFSSQGYLKTQNIMHLDDYLLEVYEIAYTRKEVNDEAMKEIRALNWGHGNYYLSIWGEPKASENWAMKFEGHHISVNITQTDGQLAITPFFLGSDPSRVRVTQYAGMRPLSKEEDYGLELFNMLSETQKAQALIAMEFPRDIITSPDRPQMLSSYQGIRGSELNEAQKAQLMDLLEEYLENFERDRAGHYLQLLHDKGLDDIYFGWVGGDARQTNHYYVIHGPDFMIEYDNAGWSRQGDHIHTIFRDKKNDFGEDLLKAHYHKSKH